MKSRRILLLVVLGMVACLSMSGCMRAYDVPELKEISPSQTAFLIPLEGKTSDQGKFMSEEYLAQAKVPSKRIQIPHRFLQEARGGWNGKYIPTMRLIIVERKPVTREWTEDDKTGTSVQNQGVVAESRESIGFMARMNCTAQIDEADAVRFLYRFNDKPLEEVMDTQIRPRIESKFVEECAKRGLADLIDNKQAIMDKIREDVIPYFQKQGITITVLGLKGEFTYLDPNIQKSINLKFTSAKEKEAQVDINAKVVSKAVADAQAVGIMQKSGAQTFELKKIALANQANAITKWDGAMPNYVGGNGNLLFNIPTKDQPAQ